MKKNPKDLVICIAPHNPEVNRSKSFVALILIIALHFPFWVSVSNFSATASFKNNKRFQRHDLLSWPSWLVRRTYKQCRSICEGQGLDLREQVFTNPALKW
jgi:hypothetical protein